MADDTPDAPTADTKPAPKPRARRSAPKDTADKPAPAKAKPAAKAPPKPRSSKRTTTAASATGTAKTAVAKTRKAATRGAKDVTKATDKVGGKWGVAAIAGGLAVAAGTAATLLTLRGSTPKAKPASKPDHGAKQADGTDSSKSFEAGIADEGSAPNA